jgi:hypothetical protein
MDFKALNVTFLHDSFPMLFNDEVLRHLVRKEVYSFTDGFTKSLKRTRKGQHFLQSGALFPTMLFLLGLKCPFFIFQYRDRCIQIIHPQVIRILPKLLDNIHHA